MLSKAAFSVSIIAIMFFGLFSASNYVVMPTLLPASYATNVTNDAPAEPEYAELAEPYIPQYNITTGKYSNDELGFKFMLPDNMTGFITEYYSDDEKKSLSLQIHPGFDFPDPSQCCPSIDAAHAVMMLDSSPLNGVSTPVPFTGDLFAAFRGYNMRMSIEELNGTEVLVSTLRSDRPDVFSDSGESRVRIGKFYFMNTDDRLLSYGLWSSPEGYQKYIDVFEKSAGSLSIKDAKPVNLDSIFHRYPTEYNLELADGSVLHPHVITPSVIGSITVDEGSNALVIHLRQTSDNDFLIMHTSDVIAARHVVTLDGNIVESITLRNEMGDEYLAVFYNSSQSDSEIVVSGSAIMPEFGSIAMLVSAVGIASVLVIFSRSLGQVR